MTNSEVLLPLTENNKITYVNDRYGIARKLSELTEKGQEKFEDSLFYYSAGYYEMAYLENQLFNHKTKSK